MPLRGALSWFEPLNTMKDVADENYCLPASVAVGTCADGLRAVQDERHGHPADDLGFADLGCYGSEIATPKPRSSGYGWFAFQPVF